MMFVSLSFVFLKYLILVLSDVCCCTLFQKQLTLSYNNKELCFGRNNNNNVVSISPNTFVECRDGPDNVEVSILTCLCTVCNSTNLPQSYFILIHFCFPQSLMQMHVMKCKNTIVEMLLIVQRIVLQKIQWYVYSNVITSDAKQSIVVKTIFFLLLFQPTKKENNPTPSQGFKQTKVSRLSLKYKKTVS